jgi:polysaccharide biosynthesis/export protein
MKWWRTYSVLLDCLVSLVLMTSISASMGCLPDVKAYRPLLVTELGASSGHLLMDQYRIQPGDVLDVKFFYNPEFNEGSMMVRPDGRISLQLAREVVAAGHTPEELIHALTDRYSGVLKNPEITVVVKSSAHRIYVDGAVKQPQQLDVVGPLTAVQAIARVGGATAEAQIDEVIVIRRALQGNQQVIQLNLEEAIEGRDVAQDIRLQPNDIVYVPMLHIANVNRWVDLYFRRNLPVQPGIFFPVQ